MPCPGVPSQVRLTAQPQGVWLVDWPPLLASSGLASAVEIRGPGRPTPRDFTEQGCDLRAPRPRARSRAEPCLRHGSVSPCLHLPPTFSQVLIPKEPLPTPDSNSASASRSPGLPQGLPRCLESTHVSVCTCHTPERKRVRLSLHGPMGLAVKFLHGIAGGRTF